MPAEYDDMTGVGSFPAGLFEFLEERYFSCEADLRSDMHPLWTIPIKRPGYMRIVQSKMVIEFVEKTVTLNDRKQQQITRNLLITKSKSYRIYIELLYESAQKTGGTDIDGN